ncbi:MAG: hypothetical protein ACE15D_06670 [Candidatus Eisenbacteria bacterium]
MIRLLQLTLRKDLATRLRYPLEWLLSTVGVAVLFVSILTALPRGTVDPRLEANILAGYMTWLIYLYISQVAVQAITGKAASGLIEREFLSPLGHLGMTLLTIGSNVLWNMPGYLVSGGILATLAFGSPGRLFAGLLYLPLAILFLFGLALVFTAADLRWKRTAALFQPLQFLMMMLAFFATTDGRAIWHWIPYTAMSIRLRDVLLDGVRSGSLIDPRPLAPAAAMLALGILVFRASDRRVMRDGTLAHY